MARGTIGGVSLDLAGGSEAVIPSLPFSYSRPLCAGLRGSLRRWRWDRPGTIATWLILPVVICLSQRLSHACLSISNLYGETANGSLNQLSFI